jgi:hypothetical protein
METPHPTPISPGPDALGIHAEETVLKSDLFPPPVTKFFALPNANPAEITKT